jgi:septum formation topological specificity factor MinE
VNEDQQSDHAYHESRLLLLIAQRTQMTADSDQIPALDIEIMAIWELVRSYRLVEAMQAL